MKKNLQNQLKAYSLLVSGAMMMPEQATAQTITVNNFTDVTLDLIGNPNDDSFTLDVNQDGTDDVKFYAVAYMSSSGKGGSLYASALTNTAILTSPVSPALGGWGTRPEIETTGTAICATATNWNSNGLFTIGNSVGGFAGAWKNQDAYIGLRIRTNSGATTQLAWVSLQVTNNGKITIKSAAYTDAGSTCINAGATTVTGIIGNNVQSDAVVFTNQNNEIVVRIPNGVVLNNEKVNVIDINGNIIYSGEFNGNETTIKADAYHHGMYLVRVTSDNVMYSGKVVLK